jgi:hypothetical protein
VTNNGTNNIPNNNTPFTRNNNNNTNNNDLPTPEKQENNKSDELEVIIAIPTIASTLERRMQVRLTYISEYKEVHCPYCPTPHPNPKVFQNLFNGSKCHDSNYILLILGAGIILPWQGD